MGFIDTQGNWVVKPQFCMAGRFSEGLAGVYQMVTGKAISVWEENGLSQYHWQLVLNPIFEKAERFKNGKAKVTYKGIIDILIIKWETWRPFTSSLLSAFREWYHLLLT